MLDMMSQTFNSEFGNYGRELSGFLADNSAAPLTILIGAPGATLRIPAG